MTLPSKTVIIASFVIAVVAIGMVLRFRALRKIVAGATVDAKLAA